MLYTLLKFLLLHNVKVIMNGNSGFKIETYFTLIARDLLTSLASQQDQHSTKCVQFVLLHINCVQFVLLHINCVQFLLLHINCVQFVLLHINCVQFVLLHINCVQFVLLHINAFSVMPGNVPGLSLLSILLYPGSFPCCIQCSMR